MMSKLTVLFVACMSLTFSVIGRQYEGLSQAYGDSVNSMYDEQAPVFSPDGRTLYFTRRHHPANTGGNKDKGDIWMSQLQASGRWSQPQPAGSQLNTEGYNAVVGFSADGNTIFLQNLYENGKGGRQGVSVAQKSGNGWSSPRMLDIPYFYNKSTHQSISLSPDGTIMVMAIESRFSYGAEDIYVSLKQAGGKWSEPINLGRTINTRFQEMTPYIAADNKTLFFASNGHGGQGSRDIFMATRLDDTWKNWTQPKNLGQKINSPGVELSFFIPAGSEYAYFTTTQNSDGYGDLRRIKLSPEEMPEEAEPVVIEEPVVEVEVEEEVTEAEDTLLAVVEEQPVVEEVVEEPLIEPVYENSKFSGRINNEQTGTGLEANVRIFGMVLEDTLAIRSGADGNFTVNLLPGETYYLKASTPGYLPAEVTIEPVDGETFVVELTPLEVGTTVQLDNILFRQGTADMLSGSEKDLQKVYEVLQENPGMRIELAGHTDNRGSGKLNLKLSRERVEAVKARLVEMGIDANRMEEVGYGGTRPIASNATEETRRLNRRVEFIIVSK